MGPGTRQLPKVPESIDPFEQFVDPTDTKSLLYFGGSLAAPSTAFMYDGLGILPLGQQLWHLTQVIQEVQKMHSNNPDD
jgi:arylsulfatase